jgi:hypothetical protein
MRKVVIDEVENVPNPLGVHSVRRPVSVAVGTEHFAVNYLGLEPGESFGEGSLRFTCQDPGTTVTVWIRRVPAAPT